MTEKVICKETQNVHEITVAKSGENSMPCPNCSPTRKDPSHKCMNYNRDKGFGNCWNDGCTFYRYAETETQYKLPEWKNYTKLTDKQVKGFEKRMIGQITLQKMNVSTNGKEVSFPYYKNGQIVNIKHRAPGKKFRTEQGCKLEWYNYDCIAKNEEIVIVEGEFDALSYIQEGIDNVISIPNGVNSLASVLDLEIFQHVEKFYIGVDTDEPGIKLRDSLLTALGSERCLVCSYGEYKDANEYLINKGYKSLQSTLDNAVYIRSKETIKLDNLLDSLKLDPTKIIEKPPVIFSIRETFQNGKEREIGIFSLGDLSLIQGLQKSKKTFLNSGILSSMLNPTVHTKFKAELPKGRERVAFFDTEQSDYYGQMTNSRIYRSSGSSNFDYYTMRAMSSEQRRNLIERYFQRNKECSFAVIDGIVDLVEDFNDISQSKELVQWVMTITNKYNVHVCNVLHENYGDAQKARGHLGSFLAQKAETVIRIQKKIGEESKSTIEAKDTRGKEFRSFDLGINENGEVFFENITLTNSNPLSSFQSQLDLPAHKPFTVLKEDLPF